MNDVFGRSMFAPKTAAREKLRNMGGIVASSAPLMQAAQGYGNGGGVNPWEDNSSQGDLAKLIESISGGIGALMTPSERLENSVDTDLQKLRSDRSVRDNAERDGIEVDEYIGRMSDGEKRFIARRSPLWANEPNNEGGIDTAGAPDNELTEALATSRMGVKFGGFLDSVGQTGIDVASAALRKTGGTGIKMGARLIIAMAETAAFLGFPEQAAEWQTEAQKEMDYGNKMLDGDIGLFGQDLVGFQVPEEGQRLLEAARIEGRATSDAPESVEGPDGYLPASIIQSRRMPTPSGVSADFQMDLMSPSLGNPRNIPSRNEIDIPLPEGSLQPSMSPGGLFMAPAGLSPADKTDRMRLKQNPATMMFAPDGSVIRNQGDLVDPIAEMERAVRAQRADGALTQGGMDSENQIDIFDQTPDELTALKLQSEMNKNPELNSIKVQDSLKAQGARRKIYVPEDPSLFDLETLTRYPGALLNLGSKGIDYLLKSQIGLDENNTPFISGPTKESSLFGKEYPGQESYQKVLDAASTDATANDINDSIFSAGKWAGEKTLDAANSIASSIKNLPEFMTGEGSGGYRGLAENLQKNRPELFTNPELIKPETNDVPPAVTTTTVPPAVTTTVPPAVTTTVPPAVTTTTVKDFAKVTPEALNQGAGAALDGFINGDLEEATKKFFGGAGLGDPEKMDSTERVKKMVSMYQEILGESDKSKAQEMSLLIAGIGFNLMAQGGPNALQNIGAAFASGTAQMQSNAATRQSRNDKIGMLGIETTIAEDAATKKFSRDLMAAAMSPSNQKDPFVNAVRVLAQNGLKEGIYDTFEEALTAAHAALAPYYGLSATEVGGLPTNKIPVYSSSSMTFEQAKAKARAEGVTSFEYNKQIYGPPPK
jgi:hypothetical protein